MDAKASYQGFVYQCRQAHTSLIGWEPPNVPALWLNIGADTGGGGGGDTQAPTASTNLRVTGTTSSSVSLAWNASSDDVGMASYEITQDAAVVSSNTSTTFTVSGLSPSTSYTFTVRARDAAGNISSPSNQVMGTTLPNTGGGGGGGGQVPDRALVGYWHNFDNGSGFIRLRDVSRDFDVINLAFGETAPGNRATIVFTPDNRTSALKSRRISRN